MSERVPDYILNYVTEIINVDIPAGELIKRLTSGKIYSKEKIQAALNNFFKIENLIVLREISLRTIADELSLPASFEPILKSLAESGFELIKTKTLSLDFNSILSSGFPILLD